MIIKQVDDKILSCVGRLSNLTDFQTLTQFLEQKIERTLWASISENDKKSDWIQGRALELIDLITLFKGAIHELKERKDNPLPKKEDAPKVV